MHYSSIKAFSRQVDLAACCNAMAHQLCTVQPLIAETASHTGTRAKGTGGMGVIQSALHTTFLYLKLIHRIRKVLNPDIHKACILHHTPQYRHTLHPSAFNVRAP